MSNITIRVPTELLERVKDIAVRDYSKESAVVRRLLRLGIEADERRERVDTPRDPVEAVS